MNSPEQNEKELRDKSANPPPETHKTVIVPAPMNSQMDGNPQQVPIEETNFGTTPKDDTPAFLEKKEGPKNP